MEKLKDLVESVELRDINRLREAVDLWEISDLEEDSKGTEFLSQTLLF